MRRLATQLVRHLPAPNALRTDGDLLAGFLTNGTEDDFVELVRRHGPLVWGVCRRVLPDAADAEDAFQATFLVLVRRGRKLTGCPTIGPWLHRVAVWTARNVRRKNARRLAKQSPLPDHLPAATADPDLSLDLDAALLALPEKFRSPIVLCHLLGFSRADAAARLGCPEGTLSAWLSRGLARLRAKLGGLDPARPLGVAAVAVPTGLASSAVRAAVASRVAVAAVSSSVSQLVDGVIRMFWVQKATAASAALVAVFALGVGVGLSGHRAVGVAEGQEKAAGVSPGPGAKADPTAVADIEKEIAELALALKAAEEKAQLQATLAALIRSSVEIYKKAGANPDDLKKALDNVARSQQDADRAAAEAKLLRDKLDKLKAAKQEVDGKPLPKPDAPKGQPNTLAAIDKQLDLLKREYDLLMVERDLILDQFEQAKRMAQKYERRVKEIQDAADALMAKRKELKPAPAAPKEDHSRVELTIGGKELGIPILYHEVDRTSARVGGAKVEGEALLVRMLVRARTDPAAPKTLFILVWNDAPDDLIESTFRACQATGYAEAVVHGKIPTNRPGIRFTPPANDPGGRRDGWFEADDVRVKFADLLKPVEKPAPRPKP